MDKCWTCKVRRKKCDGRPSTCENCSTLRITCYRGTKPAWMDGSTRQAEMAAKFKHDVKETSRRRLVVDLTASQSMAPNMGHFDSPLPNSTAHEQALQRTTPDVGPLNSPTLIDTALQATQSTPPAAAAPDSPAPVQGTEPQAELILSAYFLDKAHPYLCPFYQPSVDHGREWIRQLVRVSPVYRQVALCQSYLMQAKSLGSNAAAQEDKMFDMLEHAFGILSVSNIQDQLSGAVRILASVVQMQRFTIADKSHEDHLDAAIHLFRSIVRAPTLPLAQQLSVTEHEAWRWSVGVLLMDDMISSVLLDAEPRLYHYHAMMLTGWDLNLESIIGCTSNVALALGKAASLNAWKTACQQNGSLDVMQLSLEATRIESSLQTELSKPSPEDDLFPSFVSSIQRHESCKIWAHSTMVYLMLVVSGRQLANPKISTHTREATRLLQNIPTTLLPSLLWPILIVGYSTGDQHELRPVLDRLQRHQILDKVQPVVELLEDVWTRQPQVALSQICREHALRGFPV